MIRMFDEDTILGVSSVVIDNELGEEYKEATGLDENSEETITEDETVRDVKNDEMSKDSEKLGVEEEAVDTKEEKEDLVEKPEIKESVEVYEDYIGSLNEQIEFLKGQIDEKNRQLTSKDELILNFQYLLKEDRNRILLLETKIEEEKEQKKESLWKRLFNKSEA